MTAIFVLLKEEIHITVVDLANTFLNNFVARFEHLYGEIHMTYNVHLLSHVGETVAAWGPLWAYSAFSYESGNGTLVQLVKFTRGVANQITNKYLMYKSVVRIVRISSHVQQVVRNYSVQADVLKFCEGIMSYTKQRTFTQCNSVTVLGPAVHVPLSENEKEVFNEVGYPYDEKTYMRFVFKGQMYRSRYYSKPQKSNDEVITLRSGGYGVIEREIHFETEDG